MRRQLILHCAINNSHLVSECVTSDNDRLLPSRNRLGYAIQDDGLTEDGTSKNVADCAVRAPPHLPQVELLYTSLIGGDGCTFDTDAVLEDSLGRVNCHFIVGLDRRISALLDNCGDKMTYSVTMLYAEIKVLDIQRDIWENELL